MKSLFKQLTLPILIGISLSGISVGVLYFLLKKVNKYFTIIVIISSDSTIIIIFFINSNRMKMIQKIQSEQNQKEEI